MVIWHEVRLTLALTYVLPEDDLLAVVARLFQRLGHLGLHATVAYLDKGFCSGEIIRYLQRIGQAAFVRSVGDGGATLPTTPSPMAPAHA
jgi:hypothetical protein